MNPNEFISVATQLLAGRGEGRLRSAVSRAYYGAFHLARQFVADCGVIIPIDTLAHRNVQWCLSNSDEHSLAEVARRLRSLRQARNVADYNLSSNRFVDRAEAQAEVQRAVEIDILLAPYRFEDERVRVAPKIKAYGTILGLPLQP
ncbi:MAG TPA: hypothetical protein VFI31_17080 [Pirellulales bacterium]|nr:hypothetical protein [Pirellulales bacterium]